MNGNSDDCEVSVVGRRIHTCAAATGKARSPRVRRRVIGTSTAVDNPERSLRRVSTSAARLSFSGNVSLSETVHTPEYHCSQFERDPIRNRQPVEFLEQSRYIVIVPAPQTNRAAASRTDCRRFSWHVGSRASDALPQSRRVSTSAVTSDDITRIGSDMRTLRTCLNAAKQFDTGLAIWAVIVRLDSR